MNRRILLAGWLFLFWGTPMQAQSAYEKVARATCQCAEQENLEDLPVEERNLKLSFCMMKGFQLYKTEEEFASLDPSDRSTMQVVTRKVSVEMANICPAIMVEVIENRSRGSNPPPPEPAAGQGIFEGRFQRVDGEDVAILVLRDQNNREQKFIWLEYFQGSELLEQNPTDLTGKRVRVEFELKDMFVPRFGQYIPRKVAVKIQVLE